MKDHKKFPFSKAIPTLSLALSISVLFTPQVGFTASTDRVHAFYADEHNTAPSSPTGNRVIEIDIENMSLVNTLDVPGITNHHSDNGYYSKLYAVPKGSGYVNVVDLRKDAYGTTSMKLVQQIDLIHCQWPK